MSYYREMLKDMDDSQKLELVSIIIDSMKPAAAKAKESDDEEYSLRPFTMEELNARIDRAEAEIAAGLGIPDEEAWDDLEEELALLEKEER
jgi:two-component SAPR family response regulator